MVSLSSSLPHGRIWGYSLFGCVEAGWWVCPFGNCRMSCKHTIPLLQTTPGKNLSLQCHWPFSVVIQTFLEVTGFPECDECMKQHSAHPHEADPQLGSARHGVFRSFKPRTLSGWRISIAHMITTPHWIASSSPGFFSTIANWMLFLQLVRALSLQLYVVSYNA